MAITRIKNSTIGNKTPKYNDVLAGLPFRPIIGTASDGGNGTSASVAFTGNNVANGTITYTALSSPGSFTGTGTASPITVSGLTSGTAYTFQVKAGNSLGDSAYSAASNSVTPVTPTSFESIASATGTGSSATISFTNIPQTYQHLQIRMIGKDTFSSFSSVTALKITFNSVGGSSYAQHSLYGNAGSVFTDTGANKSNIYIGYGMPTSTAGESNMFGAAIIDIHDYASTTKNKTLRAFMGTDKNTAGDGAVAICSGLFNNTNAITSISIATETLYWNSSSTFALYGIKGA